MRGVQYRKSPNFTDIAHEGPDLGATLQGVLVKGESGIDFLQVDPKSDPKLQKNLQHKKVQPHEKLFLPTTTRDRTFVLVTSKKPEIYEVHLSSHPWNRLMAGSR